MDRLGSQIRLCIFSTGGPAHGSGQSHDELSAIRAVIQRGGGGVSLQRTQSHGSSGTVSSFDSVARTADLLNTNFLDGQGRVVLPATPDKHDESMETLLRSCSVSPNWSPGGPVRTTPCGGRSLCVCVCVCGGGGGGGGGRTYVRTYGHFFRLKGRGGLSWELDLHGRSRQGGHPTLTSRQTLGCLLSFLRGVPGHQFLTRAQIASGRLTPTPVEGANILLVS